MAGQWPHRARIASTPFVPELLDRLVQCGELDYSASESYARALASSSQISPGSSHVGVPQTTPPLGCPTA
jgi:hypothetical protein